MRIYTISLVQTFSELRLTFYAEKVNLINLD